MFPGNPTDCQQLAGSVVRNRGCIIRSQAWDVWASGDWAEVAFIFSCWWSFLLHGLHTSARSPILPPIQRSNDLPKVTKKDKSHTWSWLTTPLLLWVEDHRYLFLRCIVRCREAESLVAQVHSGSKQQSLDLNPDLSLFRACALKAKCTYPRGVQDMSLR